MSTLSKSELERYSRHIIIPDFNIEGQRKLKQSKVLVIGAGGLGCPILQYLTAAGFGTIGILDFDVVSISNLQRQVLYGVDQVGEKKVHAAMARLSQLNPHVAFNQHDTEINSTNALEIIGAYDLVIDGTDNFPTRYLVNDACVLADKPLVYGSIFQYEGQVSVFNLASEDGSYGPNYRDLFPTPPPPDMVPNCAEGGVLGVLPGIIGCLQANEAIKIVTHTGDTLSGKLFVFDALSFTSVSLQIQTTNARASITELIDYQSFCGREKDLESAQIQKEISVKQFKQWRDNKSSFQLIDVRNEYERDITHIGGQLLPLDSIIDHHAVIDRERPVVFYCRSGKRSAQAIAKLTEKHGFTNLLNLKGGLLAYADEIDSDMPIY